MENVAISFLCFFSIGTRPDSGPECPMGGPSWSGPRTCRNCKKKKLSVFGISLQSAHPKLALNTSGSQEAGVQPTRHASWIAPQFIFCKSWLGPTCPVLNSIGQCMAHCNTSARGPIMRVNMAQSVRKYNWNNEIFTLFTDQ